jgi:hypothetical protein
VQDADVGYIAWREQERTENPFLTILAEWNRARSLSRGEYLVRIL